MCGTLATARPLKLSTFCERTAYGRKKAFSTSLKGLGVLCLSGIRMELHELSPGFNEGREAEQRPHIV